MSFNLKQRSASNFGLYKYQQTYDKDYKLRRGCRICAVFGMTVLMSSVVCLLLFNYPSIANSSDMDDKVLITKKEILPDARSFTIIKNVSSHFDGERIARNTNLTINRKNDENEYDEITSSEEVESDTEEPKDNPKTETHPAPFHKIDFDNNYPQLNTHRNPYRLRNLDELVRYMNNQFKNRNPRRTIKFSGVYVRPKNNTEEDATSEESKIRKRVTTPLKPMEFTKLEKSDPFTRFKPQNVGEINLLAENKFRFAPRTSKSRLNYNKLHQRYNCPGKRPRSNRIQVYTPTNHLPGEESIIQENKKKPLSVMLDIYPMEDEDEKAMAFPEHLKEPIPEYPQYQNPYTPSPTATYPIYSNPYPYYHYPNNYYRHRNRYPRQPYFVQKNDARKMKDPPNKPSQLLVHLNLYPKKKNENSERNLKDYLYNITKLEEVNKDDMDRDDFLNEGEFITGIPSMENRRFDEVIENVTKIERKSPPETSTVKSEKPLQENFIAVPILD